MSADGKYLYRFGEFSFDAEQNVLLRNGTPLAATPKMLQLLRIMLENPGRVLEKNFLIETVWADNFVEEGNLKFTVNQLRKVLGDKAHQPVFIETLSRRGYRFIAEVQKSSGNSEAGGKKTTLQPEKSFALIQKKSLFVFIVIILLTGTAATGYWFMREGNLDSPAPVLSAPFSLEKLSTNGEVLYAVISPDGKNLAYTNGINGKTGIWLRQLESGNNVEIIQPSDDFYSGLAFSPDGNFLYFGRRSPGLDDQLDIFRLSIFGGIPVSIISQTQGWMSISPDGEKISFVRCFYRKDDFCSLWIADARTGQNEKKLITRPAPFRIGANEISADGKAVVFAAGQSENQANGFGLFEVHINGTDERELTGQKFFNIKNLTSLPGKNGWLITARRAEERNFRIWQVSASSGEAAPLTKDSENYSALSIDQNAAQLISTQVKRESDLYILRPDDPSDERVLKSVTNMASLPDGKILIASEMAGNLDIWSINRDGGGQRQLTNDPVEEFAPIFSVENDLIFFSSNRTGEVQVWQMNRDGTSQKQITKKTGGFPVFASPDKNWLYYHHGLDRTLWRISLKTGEEELVIDRAKYRFAFSPDGAQIAYAEKQGEERTLTIFSLTEKKMVKTFPAPQKNSLIFEIAWSPDGRSLAYTLSDSKDNKTLWLQPLQQETPKRITDLGNAEIIQLSYTPDGRIAYIQSKWFHDAVLLNGVR